MMRANKLLVHIGMLCAALAFGSWWTSRTILDVNRTQRVTAAVLDNADFRHYVAGKLAPVVAQSVSAPSLRSATATRSATSANAEATRRIDTVLARADVRANLEQFVSDAHANLIGLRSAPAVLDQRTIIELVHAALPTLSLQELAKVHAVRFSVPRAAPLTAGRSGLRNHFWLFFLAAIVLIALAIATSNDRRSTVKLVGAWLLGISAVHLIVLWVIPVVVVPHLTHNPWAGLITAVARAWNAGIVTGLVVLAAAGVGFMLIDLVIPRAEPAPG